MNWRRSLPRPGDRRIAVRATPDAVRQVRGGSPWLYDGSITSVSHAGAPGDLAVVFDDRRRFVAIGLWDPASPIRLKILHAGPPVTIDAH
jgi:23S rRNA (cytosine1962-C5)-methyltransferase